MSSSNQISNKAQTGFSDSAQYDQHRPGYTASATDYLLQQCRVAGQSGAKILDLAAGTGKFTEALVQREEIFQVLAIEPHGGMREVLKKKRLGNVEVMDGTAESMQVEDESVDAVVVAQAFHWFATKQALREIHRILKPHGVLGLIWNVEDYNAPRDHKATTKWEADAQDLMFDLEDNEPRFRHSVWREVFDEQSKSSPLDLIRAKEQLFSLPLGEYQEPFETWLPKEKVWQRITTLSQVAMLGDADRERAHETIMDALDSPDTKANEEGEVAVHGSTYLVWTSKIPEDGRASLTGVERPGA
ncbi:S-adenosyl-L-methionine-dependent methyltransferase [Teratosphaeria nubilosa]|uniref:S-adenosyl-L-methionine-dependent methyltransferase n=1 Tax=Teratosphaeria nubilosa TaxID=161662 RepID=A0A6G1L198_9PEZI|nr:S-adenosyl-L-methionine-dependent methyltransferase [Teratosphaeria nubilosa]